MKMKTIETDGIAYIEPVPAATDEWYLGMDHEHGDLYEAEEIFNDGLTVKGSSSLICEKILEIMVPSYL